MAFELSSNDTFFNGLINDTNFQAVEKQTIKRETRSPRKSKTTTAQGKENITPKKTARTPRKTTKEPLKVVVAQPKKTTPTPSKRKSVPLKSPKQTEKKTVNIPKIVVYEDPECKEAKKGRKNGRRASKSLEGRKSLPVSKSPSCGPKRARHSFNDLPSLKSTKKKEKPAGKSQPSKLKPDDPQFPEMLSKLEILFPGVDPEFLRNQFVRLKGCLSETIEYILVKEKSDDLPSRTDYIRRREAEKLHAKFQESFTVEGFLKLIPDPWNHFLKAEKHNCVRYAGHSLHYLKNKFKKHYVQAIQAALTKNDHSLYLANKELSKKNRLSKMRATNRSKSECDQGKPVTFDLQFVHEVAFVENESKIRAYLKKAAATKEKLFLKAQVEGALLECQSCGEVNLLRDDAVSCPANHVFCKDCVVKYLEIEMEKENFQFKCLIKCDEKFAMESLQAILSPVVMATIIKRNQHDEIKSAGIENLVCCPFCYYVVVMPPEMSILKCLNPSCLLESCRYCKQLNHIPMKCEELEKLDGTMLKENESDSSLKCIRCNKDFVKREDSEKMDCPCGATICSLCRQPFPQCPHFNKPDREPSNRLSVSSEDTKYSEPEDENPTEGTGDLQDGDDYSKEDFQFLSSSSESF